MNAIRKKLLLCPVFLTLLMIAGCTGPMVAGRQTYPGPQRKVSEIARINDGHLAAVDGVPVPPRDWQGTYAYQLLPGKRTLTVVPGVGWPDSGTLKTEYTVSVTFEAEAGKSYWMEYVPMGEGKYHIQVMDWVTKKPIAHSNP